MTSIDGDSPKGLRVADLLGLGSAGSFILTILYLRGYSITLDVNLFLYFGLNDYFRIAIEWLPPIIGFGIIGVLINKFFTRVERGATEEEIAVCSHNPKFTRWFRKLADASGPIILVIIAVINTVLSFFRHIPPERLYLQWGASGVVLWFMLVAWYVREPKMVHNWNASIYLFVWFFPALAIYAFCNGLYAGKTDTQLYIKPSDVHILTKDQLTPMGGRILFLLDSYVVFREQQTGNGVIVFPKSEVTKIVYLAGS